MGIIVDLIIILIISACVYGGYRHGLARCLLKFLTSILAIIIALFLYKPFVNFIMNNNSGNNDKIVSDDSGLPKPIENYMNKNIKETVDEKKEAAISEVSKNAAILIIDIAGVIVIYIIAKIILKILTIFTDIISKLPIINQCNKLGGIIYGILEAFVILLIICTIISIITPLIGDYTISNIILESFIGKILYNNNIFLNLIF